MEQRLTEKGKAKLMNLQLAGSGLSLLGAIGGVVYSNKTGGGFWRGVGYFVLGGLVLGTVSVIVTTPIRSKIIEKEVQFADEVTPSGTEETNSSYYE